MSENATLHRLHPGTSSSPTDWPKNKHIAVSPPKQDKMQLPSLIRWEKQLSGQLETLQPPCNVSIGSLLDDRLRLIAPLTLKLEREGEFYIARFDNLEEFGYGYTAIQAIDDFRQTLAELYWTLNEEQARLSQSLSKLWEQLGQVVQEI